MIEKLFYSMGEVAEMFDVNASLLRHWEAQFSVIRPKRNKKGNRLFTPSDVANLKLIYHLVKECGMTLEGAKRAMKQQRDLPTSSDDRDMKLLEGLHKMRSMLEEVRQELNTGDQPAAPETAVVRPRRSARPIVRADQELSADAGVPIPAAVEGEPVGAKRRGRRKKEDAESKELFAFYEQSLF